PLVGVGSVCRRQGTAKIETLIKSLYARGLRNLHGFGLKTRGLTGRRSVAGYLASADSMSWSKRARNAWKVERQKLCGGDHKGGCTSCFPWAVKWRDRLLRGIRHATRNGTQQLLC